MDESRAEGFGTEGRHADPREGCGSVSNAPKMC